MRTTAEAPDTSPERGPVGDPLAEGADVWLLAEEDVERFAEATGGLELLTEEERARHDRLLFPAARTRFLGARLLSRQVLSQDADVAPGEGRGGHGRGRGARPT